MNGMEYFKKTPMIMAAISVLIFIVPAIAPAQSDSPFLLSSGAFKSGERIPVRYTCDGDNLSPALAWSGLPKGTASLALIVDDPDAPGRVWVHWVVYHLNPKSGGIPEGIPAGSIGAVSGINDFKTSGYRGPCPPKGAGNHHYIFTLYALSKVPDIPAGATKAEVLAAIKDITIKKTTLTGIFSR